MMDKNLNADIHPGRYNPKIQSNTEFKDFLQIIGSEDPTQIPMYLNDTVIPYFEEKLSNKLIENIENNIKYNEEKIKNNQKMEKIIYENNPIKYENPKENNLRDNIFKIILEIKIKSNE